MNTENTTTLGRRVAVSGLILVFMEIDWEEMGCMCEDDSGSESLLIRTKLYQSNNNTDPSKSVPLAKECNGFLRRAR